MFDCRFCGTPLSEVFVSLGHQPLSNAYLPPEALGAMEPTYPLDVYTCADCLLVQVPAFETPEAIFGDYAYFSSYSSSWLAHAEAYVGTVTERLGLGPDSMVVEIASNDGYLLQYVVERGIPALGIEPARNVAEVAIAKGVPTRTVFFGVETAKQLAAEGYSADLLLGNNVLAHVPDLNDFVAGMKVLLKPGGVITMEFPHLVRLIEGLQFDTIYHEHFSYYSFLTAREICRAHGLEVYDVEELSTHGGSLRLWARHAEDASKPEVDRTRELAKREVALGVGCIDYYHGFEPLVRKVKRDLLAFLIDAKERGLQVVGYGAPAKGNTLLNYCGISTDFLDYTVDLNPTKQGTFLPGSHIPVYAPERIAETRPDLILVLPWNIVGEISRQLEYTRGWGAKLVVPLPACREV